MSPATWLALFAIAIVVAIVVAIRSACAQNAQAVADMRTVLGSLARSGVTPEEIQERATGYCFRGRAVFKFPAALADEKAALRVQQELETVLGMESVDLRPALRGNRYVMKFRKPRKAR